MTKLKRPAFLAAGLQLKKNKVAVSGTKHGLWLAIALFCLLPQSMATHLIGAYLRSECLNTCDYRIYLYGYYDCASALTQVPPNIPPLPTFSFEGPTPTCVDPTPLGPATVLSYLEPTPLCPGTMTNCNNSIGQINGVMEFIAYRDYSFCGLNCTNYTVSYINCCRSNSSTTGGANEGFYIETNFELLPNACNNTPEFVNPGVKYGCAGETNVFDFSAIDPDGDSLVYQFQTCYGDQGVPISYLPAHGPQQPFGPDWAVGLDSISGILTINPNPVGASVRAIVCIQITEIRNGAIIAETNHDFEVYLLSCPSQLSNAPYFESFNMLAGGTKLSPNQLGACAGDSLVMEIQFWDPDTADVLALSSNIQNTLPGSNFSYLPGNPAYAYVSWVPDSSFLDSTVHFWVKASDETCLVPQTKFQVFEVLIGENCLTAIITNTACDDSTGMIDLSVEGGSPPFTYLWNNGSTTEDISGLTVGIYWVDVTDASGVVMTDTFFVSASDILFNETIVPANCNQPTGSISVAISGGVMPYAYMWSTGDTTLQIANVPSGGYSLIVTDSAGCFAQKTWVLDPPDSCFITISGTVFNDQNGNCVQDSLENGMPYILIDAIPGGATVTDANGYYEINVLDTGAYVINVITGPYGNPLCPVSGMHNLNFSSFDDDTAGIDFALEYIANQNLTIDLISSFITVPGLGRYHNMYVYNGGNTVEDAVVRMEYDVQESFGSSYPIPDFHDPVSRQLEWHLPQYIPGSYQTIAVITHTATSAMLGDTLKDHVRVEPIMGDTSPHNNQDSSCHDVITSYDPNDKLVTPKGMGMAGYLLPNQTELEYTIRFQNTGNFPALYVEIRDTLDPSLQWLSFQALNHSHPYSMDLLDDSILVFTFDNINLPDSSSDPLGSQGHVHFSLHLGENLPPGTPIQNKAAIYFDFNLPIITNEVLNTTYAYPSISLASTSLCEGEFLTATLQEYGVPPYTVEWSNGDQSSGITTTMFETQVFSSGTYSLIITDALGFSTTDTQEIVVFPLPTAIFQVQANGTEVSFDNQSTNALGWSWDFGDGTTSSLQHPMHDFGASGSYQVRLIAENGCGFDTLQQQVDVIATGLDDPFAASVQVVPNPFKDQTEIRFSNPHHIATSLTVFDLNGRAVRRIEGIKAEKIVLSRENMNSGIYLIQLNGPGYFSAKIRID